MRSKTILFSLTLALGICIAPLAGASPITGFGLPTSNAALSGATLVDLSAAATGFYTDLTIGDLTIDSGSAETFEITDALGGGYNSTGRNLQNNTTGTHELTFTFGGTISAFGFNFGASNEDWRLEAYDAGNALIESHILAQTWFSNAGDFFGVAANGIAKVRLVQLTNVNDPDADHILLDNVAYTAADDVPEPASLALLGAGLLGAAWRRSKARR